MTILAGISRKKWKLSSQMWLDKLKRGSQVRICARTRASPVDDKDYDK